MGGDHEANNVSNLDECEEGEPKDTLENGSDDVFKDDEHILAALPMYRSRWHNCKNLSMFYYLYIYSCNTDYDSNSTSSPSI